MPAPLRSYLAMRPIRNSEQTIIRWEGLGLLLATDLRQAREMAAERWRVPLVVRTTYGISPRIRHLWKAWQEANEKSLVLPLPRIEPFLSFTSAAAVLFPSVVQCAASFVKTSDSRFVLDRVTGELISESEAIGRLVSDLYLTDSISILSEYDHDNSEPL